jgi:hypothetical protein
MVREDGMGKWRGLILTVGLNQQQLRWCQSNRTINIMKFVNQDLWLGMSLASNGAKSFACA